jgi:hypothetical protein
MCSGDCSTQKFENFVVRKSPGLVSEHQLERKLYDAKGLYRGELAGPRFEGSVDWDHYGIEKHFLLDAYQPESPPTDGDWVLVLEANDLTPRSVGGVASE